MWGMQLLLVRHAIAEERRPGQAEEDRALTDRGRERFEGTALGVLALGAHPARVLTSPLRRARETAQILADTCGGRIEVVQALAAAPAESLLTALRGDDAAAVGHEPWMSALCAWLVAGSIAPSYAFAFKKGGCALLEGEPEPGGMRLVAFLPPRVLRALGGSEA